MPADEQGSWKNRHRTSTITRQELQDVLADPGYSADSRKEWLKEVLTELEQQEATETLGETSDLTAEVKAAIRSLQPKPISDDIVSSRGSLKDGDVMAKCETCGNEYDKAFQVTQGGRTHTYDSFECAIHALAPTCSDCGIRIIGHGLERGGKFFCCDHCAKKQGVTELRDRA